MNKQTGYTIAELITAVFSLAFFGLVCFALYAAIHFMLKFW